jgi:hypothetical protein
MAAVATVATPDVFSRGIELSATENKSFLSELTGAATTAIGQINRNTTDTVHISLLTWCWTTFCLQHRRNPS